MEALMTNLQESMGGTLLSKQKVGSGNAFRLGGTKMGCLVLVWAATVMASQAQTFTTLASFNGANGAYPEASLIQGLNGNFYGTTFEGGSSNNGTVFKITPGGTLTTLYSFCAQSNCGDLPYGGLVLGTDGKFYGTTVGGGTNCGGCGTVFAIAPEGQLTTLYSFCSLTYCRDGGSPYAALVQATNGNFYGTTTYSGAKGHGTVFEITAGGAMTRLSNFDGSDGDFPEARLVQATNGKLYGATFYGGSYGGPNCANNGCGTLFEMTPGGRRNTLYTFCLQTTCTDGSNPVAGLVQATNGNLYGTTEYGGANCVSQGGCGTVFEITAGGKLTTLYSFCSQPGCTDGEMPIAGLVQASDGNFYGPTAAGGANSGCRQGCGTIFRITPNGTLTTLYNFCSQSGCADGSYPYGGLLQATGGRFYGTTLDVGTSNFGTVFSLDLGLPPFIETLPVSGKLGTKVIILGRDIKGATSVAFNGTSASFRVVSNTEIKTSVPKGATTGAVKVTTPNGKLKSNVPFQVTR
jgi:uncharacterized repeat protein (TIGR03803 family)